jgi:two-component system sensor kinase FixL
MMATSRVLIGAMSHEIRNLAAAASAAYRELARGLGAEQRAQSQPLGTVIDALENIASSGLRLAAHSSAAVADLGMVLDEARVLIEASFRDEGSVAHWLIPDSLPLVEADHHSLLQVFLNLARNSERAPKGCCGSKSPWKRTSCASASAIPAPECRIPRLCSSLFSRAPLLPAWDCTSRARY